MCVVNDQPLMGDADLACQSLQVALKAYRPLPEPQRAPSLGQQHSRPLPLSDVLSTRRPVSLLTVMVDSLLPEP